MKPPLALGISFSGTSPQIDPLLCSRARHSAWWYSRKWSARAGARRMRNGKTIIAAASAKRIAPKGRLLVLVPTLDLLIQTVQAWHAAGHKGPAVAVLRVPQEPLMGGVACVIHPVGGVQQAYVP
ncbi:hypothetical protein [Streptomyces halobius]|uniref:hypothetical protein n=1 Tax=Streptomyces halobius TaxID=2879846 RepID=UPI0038731EC9